MKDSSGAAFFKSKYQINLLQEIKPHNYLSISTSNKVFLQEQVTTLSPILFKFTLIMITKWNTSNSHLHLITYKCSQPKFLQDEKAVSYIPVICLYNTTILCKFMYIQWVQVKSMKQETNTFAIRPFEFTNIIPTHVQSHLCLLWWANSIAMFYIFVTSELFSLKN